MTDDSKLLDKKLKDIVDNLKQRNTQEAMNSIIELLKNKNLDLDIQSLLLARLYLCFYKMLRKEDDVIAHLKRHLPGNIDFDAILPRVKYSVVKEVEFIYKYYCTWLRTDFFINLSLFDEFLTFLRSRTGFNFDTVHLLLFICFKCKDHISKNLGENIAHESLMIIKEYFDNDISQIQEKKLEDFFKFLKCMCSPSDYPIINSIKSNIMFQFALSGQLTKIHTALRSFNSIFSYSEDLLNTIKSRNIVEHILNNMHQDLTELFISFLIKVWKANSSYFDINQLTRFWEVCINQHETIISSFFSKWSILYEAIPSDSKPDFWKMIINTKTFPPSSLRFLESVSRNPDSVTQIYRHSVAKCLWNAVLNDKNSNGIQYVSCLTEFISKSYAQKNYIELSFNLIKESKKVPFALSLLDKLLTNPTKDNLNTILEMNSKLEVDEIPILLNIISNLCKSIYKRNEYLDDKDIQNIKQIIEPLIFTEASIVNDFLNDLIKSGRIRLDKVKEIFAWLVGFENPNINFILTLFKTTNEIESKPLKSLNLIGIESVINLFRLDNEVLSNFFVDLLLRCTDVSVSVSLLKMILNQFQVNKSFLSVLSDYFSKILLPSRRTCCCLFNPYKKIRVIVEKHEDFEVPLNENAGYLKRMICNTYGYNIFKAKFSLNEEPLEDDHQFKLRDVVNVVGDRYKGNIIDSKVIDLLQPIFKTLQDQLMAEIRKNSEFGIDALEVLLLFKEIGEERQLFNDPSYNWDTIFDIKEPLLLRYRLHIFASILMSNHVIETRVFYNTGVFSKLLELLINNQKIIDSNRDVDVLIYILELLIDNRNYYDVRENSYKLIGRDLLLNSLILLVLDRGNMFYLTKSVLSIISDLSVSDKSVFINHPKFDDFLRFCLFNMSVEIRENFASIMKTYSSDVLEKILINHIKYSMSHQSDYFYLLIDVCSSRLEDCCRLWTNIVRVIMDNLFTTDPRTVIPNDFGHEKSYSSMKANIPKNYSNILVTPEEICELDIKTNNADSQSESVLHVANDELDTNDCVNHNDVVNPKDGQLGNNDTLFVTDPTKIVEDSFDTDDSEMIDEFTLKQLKQSMLELSSTLADVETIKHVYDSLFAMIDKYGIKGSIPYAEEFCLFSIEKIVFNVARYIPTPSSLFDLIKMIIQREPQISENIFSCLINLQSSKTTFVEPLNEDLSLSSNRGISNLRCTCYLSASLQQIVRIPEVRDAVLAYRPDDDIDSDWLAQLQLLFIRLLYSPVSSVDPTPFIRLFKGSDGNPIEITEQHDATEFIQTLLNRIDEKIPSKPIKNSLVGKIRHTINSIDPTIEFSSSSTEDFVTFSLGIINQNNLHGSFKSSLLPDTFVGSNQYQTDKIGKIDAEIRHCLEYVPDMFILSLKRFDFDLSTLDPIKLDNTVEYPPVLNIKPYTSSKEDDIFDLTGVVMHIGNASFGHYYSYVKDDGKWFMYNDNLVYKSSLSKVTGVEFVEASNITDGVNKWKTSAYILFYRRQGTLHSDLPPACRIPARVLARFLSQNKALIYREAIYKSHSSYINFIAEALSLESCMKAFEVVYRFFLLTLTNQHVSRFNKKFYDLIKNKVEDNPEFAKFMLVQVEVYNGLHDRSSRQLRILYGQILTNCVGSATKTKEVTDLIERLVGDLKFPLENYEILDKSLYPVLKYVYVLNDEDHEGILTAIVNFLTVNLDELPQQSVDLIIRNSDLSCLFRILTLLISKSEERKHKYNSVFINEEFLKRWFRSDNNSYELARLLAVFQKNSFDVTSEMHKYIKSKMKTSSDLFLASHFISILTIDDEHSKERASFYFDIINVNNDMFARKMLSALNSFGIHIVTYLINSFSDLWMGWFHSKIPELRKCAVLLIQKSFPEFPTFEEIPSLFGKNSTEPSFEKVSPARLKCIEELFSKLITLNRSIIMTNDDTSSSLDLFDALSYVTFYSQMGFRVNEIGVQISNNMRLFCKNDNQSAVLSVLKYVRAFVSDLKNFFRGTILKEFLESIAGLFERKRAYDFNITSLVIELITPLASERYESIIQSGVLRALQGYMFFPPLDHLSYELLVELFKHSDTSELSKYVINKEMFVRFCKTDGQKYMKLLLNIVNQKENLDLFEKQKLNYEIVRYINELVASQSFDLLHYPLCILEQYTRKRAVPNENSDKKNIISWIFTFNDPVNSVIKFWSDNEALLKSLMKEVQSPKAPSSYVDKVFCLFSLISMGIQKLQEFILKCVRSDINTLYYGMPKRIRIKTATLRIDIIRSGFVFNNPEIANYINSDIKAMMFERILDVDLYDIYAKLILDVQHNKIDELTSSSYINMFTKVRDVKVYKGYSATLLSHITLSQYQANTLMEICLDVIINSFTSDKDEVDLFKTAVDFVDILKKSSGNCPVVKIPSQLKNFECKSESLQYFNFIMNLES